MLIRFRCETIERHHGDPKDNHPRRTHERQAVRLRPVQARDPNHPNRIVWRGLAVGELCLEELEPGLVADAFELGREYVLEVRAADDEPTNPGIRALKAPA